MRLRAPSERSETRISPTIGARVEAAMRASRRGRVGALSMAAATVNIHCRRVYFGKWAALGDDQLIGESAALPFELTPARVRLICAAHTGFFSDGVLLLSPGDEPGYVARLRI